MTTAHRPVYADLGPVSSGTMRPEDLIPTLMNLLDDLKERVSVAVPNGQEAQAVARVSAIDGLLGDMEVRQNADDYYESEDADHDLEDLFNALEEFAPPYAYFGTSEGDGACYGFWISHDNVRDDVMDETTLSVTAGDEWPDPLPEGTEYVYECNDHGNATLYYPDHSVVWSVV